MQSVAINMRLNILRETEDRRAAAYIQRQLQQSMKKTEVLRERERRLALAVKLELQNKIDAVDNGT